jgi:predicted nucleic acid-binding protein
VIYFDTSYIARLYFEDEGWEEVRKLAATDQLACSLHGRAETVAAFHRKFREGALTKSGFAAVLDQFETECKDGGFQWLAVSPAVVNRMIGVYKTLASTVPLRAADAIHLACAAENGFREIYSNDARLIAAAAQFGIRGLNRI